VVQRMVMPAVARAVLISFACSFLTVPTHAVFLRAGLKDLAAPAANQSKHLASSEEFGPHKTKHFAAQAPAASAEIPSMFVAIMTTRDTPVLKRNAIRELWNSVNGGTGHVCYRFIVCTKNDTLQTSLVAEQTSYGDLLVLDCEEGYAHGLLTKKVIATMDLYRNAASRTDAWCLDRELFMKVDDDTFVRADHFRQGLSAAAASVGTAHMYAGVFSRSAPVGRNESSPWFEPVETWPNSTYPAAMYGGPGYILGKSIVQQVIDQRIANRFVLE